MRLPGAGDGAAGTRGPALALALGDGDGARMGVPVVVVPGGAAAIAFGASACLALGLPFAPWSVPVAGPFVAATTPRPTATARTTAPATAFLPGSFGRRASPLPVTGGGAS